MTITVRQEHIDAARSDKTYCWRCPVWQAAEEAGMDSILNVSPHWIHRTHFAKGGLSMRLPASVTAWILAFDTGKPVEPFSFEVDYE